MNMNLRNQLLEKFADKEYRDNFVQEYIFSRVPLKIKSMRDARDMSQQDLGQMAGIAQPWVSKLEDPNYGRLTLSTLLKIASAFDVALHVDFVPFSEILNRSTLLSEDDFAVPSYDSDKTLVYVEPRPPEAKQLEQANIVFRLAGNQKAETTKKFTLQQPSGAAPCQLGLGFNIVPIERKNLGIPQQNMNLVGSMVPMKSWAGRVRQITGAGGYNGTR